MSETDELIQEYKADFDDLMAGFKASNIPVPIFWSRYERLVNRYSLAAEILTRGAYIPTRKWASKDTIELDGLFLLLSTYKSADEDWQERAWLLGYCAIKTIGEFRARLWGAVERLFKGGTEGNFIANFARSIDQQLTEAWNEGARSVGVEPDEMTEEDLQVLTAIIDSENGFIEGIMAAVEEARDEGMEQEKFVSKFGSRVDLWANRYTETVNRARMHFGAQSRLEWQLGLTKDHCGTCSKLNGIVAFGREWEQARVHPQMPPNELLECEGWGCDCRLNPTKKKRTSRALARITDIVMAARL